MFDLIDKAARSAVNVAADTAGFVIGGDGPSRADVAALLSAGMSVAAVVELTGLAEETVVAIMEAGR